jgi:hypothetical protein
MHDFVQNTVPVFGRRGLHKFRATTSKTRNSLQRNGLRDPAQKQARFLLICTVPPGDRVAT